MALFPFPLASAPEKLLFVPPWVMKESLVVVLVAEVIGMAGAMILGRFLSTLLFGVTLADPITLAAVGLVSAMTAFAASYVPTRSAMGVDPAIILRGE